MLNRVVRLMWWRGRFVALDLDLDMDMVVKAEAGCGRLSPNLLK